MKFPNNFFKLFTPAIVILCLVFACSDDDPEPQTLTKELTEREALIAFYNANPNNKLTWDITSMDISKWAGVTVEAGTVIELSCVDDDITKLPKEIRYLPNLKSLYINSDLQYNN